LCLLSASRRGSDSIVLVGRSAAGPFWFFTPPRFLHAGFLLPDSPALPLPGLRPDWSPGGGFFNNQFTEGRMKIPSEVVEITQKAAEKYPRDIDKASENAEKRIRKLPNFGELAADLVRSAIRDLVYDARHNGNTAMKKADGQYGGPGKVTAASSKSVNEAARSVYLYFIAGRTLGDLMGEELLAVAESEQAHADGHKFNARLCRTLAPMVPKKKRVQDAIKERKLWSIFQQVKEKVETDAA
jgi:hypothetical protein